MIYSEAVQYIENVPRFAKTSTLSETKRLLALLGNPDREMKIIHVAGTNGKGSVCSYLESMLRAGGYRTGLFTSPHLVKMNERFMIGREPVDDDTLLRAFLRVKDVWEREGDYHPTYFEILFLMAMVIFREQGVEAAVLETGLGGCFDATNAVHTAEACVITSVSYDHMAVLGNDIRDIAAAKAGIMKPGVPCFYIDTDRTISEVMEKHAYEVGCDAFPVCTELADDRIVIISKGKYQRENASLAFYAMTHLPVFELTEEEILKGLKNANWPGRMEEIAPGIFLDGAHNDDGILKFAESAAEIAAGKETVLLFSAVADKEYTKMAATLAGKLSPVCVITTQVSSERGVPHGQLADVFRNLGLENVLSYGTVKEALTAAVREKGEKILFCVGSLYLIGEIKGCAHEVLKNA